MGVVARAGARGGHGAGAVQTLADFERAGADRVILQWLDLDDVDGLHILADAVL